MKTKKKYSNKKRSKKNKSIKKNTAGNTSTSAFAFCDGSKVYERYDKKYKRHKKGLVILGPPGIGKTTFVRKNEDEIWKSGNKLDWIDQDDLCNELGVDWHHNSNNQVDFKLNYQRADYITEQSKQMGYRLIGSLFWEYKADAIVIPPWETHSKYLENRKDLNHNVVKEVRKILEDQAKKMKIPVFKSIEEAVKFLGD